MHTPGIHHITGITADPQKNIDFYTGVLGLRLIKLTVNFDDPSAYHLYYGNTNGEPGTIATFFAWPAIRRGIVGTGEITTMSFAVSTGSMGFWENRFKRMEIPYRRDTRFEEECVTIRDPDGLEVELVAENDIARIEPWRSMPSEYAIRGFHGVTLCVDSPERTQQFLTEHFGYRLDFDAGTMIRYTSGSVEPGRYLYVRIAPDLRRGAMGAGTIHHAAFRALSDEDEVEIRDALIVAGMDATPVIDRQYFHSVYFREPGGVLFEIATDEPGFTVDESAESLGTALQLPPQYEPHRTEIIRSLPAIRFPTYE